MVVTIRFMNKIKGGDEGKKGKMQNEELYLNSSTYEVHARQL